MMRTVIALILATAIMFAQDFSLSDDFVKYPDGFPAEWIAANNWKIVGGKFINDSPSDRVMVFAKGVPSGVELKAEAVLVPKAALSDSWKSCGIVIYENPTNFWQFALIGPSKEFASKLSNFFELKQMYGMWGYTNNISPVTTDEVSGFSTPWNYGSTYVLRIEMNEKGVIGTAKSEDGKTICRLTYTFRNRNGAVSGKPGISAGGVKTEFSLFRTKITKRVP
ncbi:MAG: hypothetical protein AABZ39_08345 [Spirochaetota bacterium]